MAFGSPGGQLEHPCPNCFTRVAFALHSWAMNTRWGLLHSAPIGSRTKTTGYCLLAATAICIASSAAAFDSLVLRSTCLGEGRFQYELQIADDPWIKRYEGMHFHAFTNASLLVPVSRWTNTSTDASWSYQDMTNGVAAPLPHPQTVLFEAHSTSAAFRRGVALVGFIFAHQDDLVSKSVPVTLAGFARMAALVPCAAGDADGSPDTLSSAFAFHDDITVQNLVTLSNHVYGLSFDFPLESTVVVQGSPDIKNWTNISYALGNPGVTTWTSAVPIEAKGPFFRVLLFSTMHRPEMVESVPSSAPAGDAALP